MHTQLHQEVVASTSDPEPPKTKQQETGQSAQTPIANSEPRDNIFQVLTVVQHIIVELKGALSKEAKILTITKIVFNLMKGDGK
jgi:hypothetical protein